MSKKKIVIISLTFTILLIIIGSTYLLFFKKDSKNTITNSAPLIQKYTITFSVDGTSKAIEVNNANEIDITKLDFEKKENYVLKWYLNEKEYDFTTPLTNDITIEGKYIRITGYVITFNSNDGTYINSQIVNKDEKMKKPTDPLKEGYTFKEWQSNGIAFDFETPITDDIILDAIWDTNKYTITFDTIGGNSINNQIVDYNEKASKPTDPLKEGYTFKEWQLNKKTFNFETPITDDITLNAVWNINKYTITFDTTGGNSINNQIVNYNEKVTKPSDPLKEGYTFKEWQLDGKQFDFESTIKNDIVLKAVYTEQYVTPEMFGAIGDGIADDTSAFVAVFKHKNVVLNNSKKYKITKAIEISTNLNLSGNNATIILSGDEPVWLNSSNKNLNIDGINIIKTGGICTGDDKDDKGELKKGCYNRCIRSERGEYFSIKNSTFTGCFTAIHNLNGINFEVENVTLYDTVGTIPQNGYGINTSAIYNTIKNVKGINNTSDNGRHFIYQNGKQMKKTIIADVYVKNWNGHPLYIKSSDTSGSIVDISKVEFDNVNVVPLDDGPTGYKAGAIYIGGALYGKVSINNYINRNSSTPAFMSKSENSRVYLDNVTVYRNVSPYPNAAVLNVEGALFTSIKNVNIIGRRTESTPYAIQIRDGSTCVLDNITDNAYEANSPYSIFNHFSTIYLGTYTTNAAELVNTFKTKTKASEPPKPIAEAPKYD